MLAWKVYDTLTTEKISPESEKLFVGIACLTSYLSFLPVAEKPLQFKEKYKCKAKGLENSNITRLRRPQAARDFFTKTN